MPGTLDRNELQAVIGELQRLVHRLGEVKAGFSRVATSPDLTEARKRAFLLSADVPEVRAFGTLDRVTEDERHGLIASASPETAVRQTIRDLLDLMRGAPLLHRALAHVLPHSFTPPGGEWWERYRAELRALREQPIWGIPEPHRVPLGEIYVPHRYREERPAAASLAGEGTTARAGRLRRRVKTEGSEVHQDLLPHLREWVTEADPRMVFVVGGPGSGKSTLASMLASELAVDPLVQPLLIRLRDVRPEADLFDEITRVLADAPLPDGVGKELAAVFSRAPRLVLLLDGFDELIHASRTGLGSFFLRAQDLLRDHRVQGVVCFGRDTVFAREDTAIPKGVRLVTLLPFDDAQVTVWCERWEAITGRAFDWRRFTQSPKTPEFGGETDTDVLRALAHEPLTLRLLALLDLEGVHVLSESGEADLPRVYHRVITEVCRRHQDDRRGDFSAAELRRLLRVLGYTVMQSGQELIRLDDLQRSLQALGLSIETSKTDSKATQLILAISQRQSERDERAWEFLHRSLGEYLAAEFLASEIAVMVTREKDEFGEQTYRLTQESLCRRWIERFGPAIVSPGVERFLERMAGDWPAFFERGVVSDPDRDLVLLAARLGSIYPALLDETEAETTLRVGRAWSLRPSDVTGIALGNLFLLAGLRWKTEAWFYPELHAPGRYADAYHAMRRSPAQGQWERICERTAFKGIAPGTDLSGMQLGGSNWDAVQGSDLQLLGASLRGISAKETLFEGCNQAFSFWGGSNIQNTGFVRCWMIDASFEMTTIRRVRFEACALAGAMFPDFWKRQIQRRSFAARGVVVIREKHWQVRRSFELTEPTE